MSTGYLNYASVVENEQDGSLMYYRCATHIDSVSTRFHLEQDAPICHRNYCVAKAQMGVKLSQNLFLTTTDGELRTLRQTSVVMLDAFTPIYDGRPNVPQSEGLKLWFPSTKYMELIRVERWYVFLAQNYFLPTTNASRLFFLYTRLLQ